MKNYQELIKDLQNTAILYCEDRESNKPTEWIKDWMREIVKMRNIETKYKTIDQIIDNAYLQLENIYTTTKTKNIEETRQEMNRLFNIFTLASGILTTEERI